LTSHLQITVPITQIAVPKKGKGYRSNKFHIYQSQNNKIMGGIKKKKPFPEKRAKKFPRN